MITQFEMAAIEKFDRQFHILKRTGVMLMPRWQKFKCKTKEDLILALKIEKVWFRFMNDMQHVRLREKALIEAYTNDQLLDHILELATRDFKVGNEREDLVAEWLVSKGWEIAPYSDKTAYSLEGQGIDIVCSKDGVTRNIQVKSGGFMYAPEWSQYKQLKKMVTHGTVLFVVNQWKNNKMSYYSPDTIKEWFNNLEERRNHA